MLTLVNVDFQYNEDGGLGVQEKKLGVVEISKVKIENDERLFQDFTWAQKSAKMNDMQKAVIQASIETCVLRNSHLGFIKFHQ